MPISVCLKCIYVSSSRPALRSSLPVLAVHSCRVCAIACNRSDHELYPGMAKPTPLAWMCGIGSTQRANRKEEGDLRLEFPPEINEMK